MSFENASVTKGLIITTSLTSLLSGLFDIKHFFHLTFSPHISKHHQYWRLITHHLAFSNSSDLFIGALVFYNVGIHVERQFGTVKFASFLTVSLLVSTLLEFVTLMFLHRFGLNQIAMGPSVMIFNLLYQYSRIVPPIYRYHIFGVELNNKSLQYLLGLQLAVMHIPVGVIVALIGIFSGQIYRSDLAGLNTYRLPKSLLDFFSTYISLVFGVYRSPRRSNRAMPDGGRLTDTIPVDEVITTARTPRAHRSAAPETESGEARPSVMREWVDELTGRTARENAGLRVPTEAEITQIVAIFPTMEREVLVGALQRSANIEVAVETLLTSQS
ncbi:hypothetical protein BJ165DRAFT_1521171 [Panaeolus papilionaceus]|nr:hypothetical protein BJ165DRAFT_1521171 [Panaeolus papilionaceus]